MDDSGSPTIGILIFVVLILLDFVIFGFIAAMQNLNETAVEKMAKEGNARAELLMKYTDKAEQYTNVCHLGLLIVHMLLGFFQVARWKALIVKDTAGMGVSAAAYILIFAVLIILVLVIGIYTPGKVAARQPERWALVFVGFIHGMEVFFKPIILLADSVSNLLSRFFGVDPHSDPDDVTEEEIISMVNEGHEQGVLLASEAEMIHNIFEFGDKEAKDIMTHRKNIIAINGELPFIDAISFLKENNYSRFPVYLDSIDNIIGVLHIKEALALSQEHELFDWQIKDIEGLVREVDVIPETRNINTLFTMMQTAKSHMVIVVDEYGQTAGIVAMEDILEEIVGNIEDEHDEEEQMIVRLADGSFRMDGMAEFSDVMEELGIEQEAEDENDFETLNGFLISLIDKIPNDDEVFSTTAYGYLFEILSVKNKIIRTVRVTKLPEDVKIEGAEEENACQQEETVVK